jgi:hypothetical protein
VEKLNSRVWEEEETASPNFLSRGNALDLCSGAALDKTLAILLLSWVSSVSTQIPSWYIVEVRSLLSRSSPIHHSATQFYVVTVWKEAWNDLSEIYEYSFMNHLLALRSDVMSLYGCVWAVLLLYLSNKKR